MFKCSFIFNPISRLVFVHAPPQHFLYGHASAVNSVLTYAVVGECGVAVEVLFTCLALIPVLTNF
jgi:hypothetical protein